MSDELANATDQPGDAPVTASPGHPPLGAWLPHFALLALVWGSSFLFIEVAIRQLHPVYVALGRSAFGALTLVIVLKSTGGALPRRPIEWLHLSVVGVVGVALPFILFPYGEQRISSALAGIWNATTPLVALPLSVLVYRIEKFTVRRVVGLLIGFGGVLVVLGVWQGVGGAQLTGQAMCFAAAGCYGVAIPYIRKFLAGSSLSGVAIPAGQLIIATVVLAIAAPILAGAPPAPSTLRPEVIGSLLALGALGSGLAFLLHFRVIRTVGATAGASVAYLFPVVATTLGVLVLSEPVTWHQPVGAAIVLVGVAVAQGFRLKGRARRSTPAAR